MAGMYHLRKLSFFYAYLRSFITTYTPFGILNSMSLAVPFNLSKVGTTYAYLRSLTNIEYNLRSLALTYIPVSILNSMSLTR